MKLHIEPCLRSSPGEAEVEIVERKGKGHPDSICDNVAEEVSRALCEVYTTLCGRILHHNCDKGLLVAGGVEKRFGGGRVTEPMQLVLGGRATTQFGGRRIDVREIAVEAARKWVRQKLKHVDVKRHVLFRPELKPGSEQLMGLFGEGAGRILRANDTSAAVGYAPLTETERLVLSTERFLNSDEFKDHFPESGEDVKVMGVRTRRHLALTVAMPLLDRYLQGERDYFDRKQEAVEVLREHLDTQIEAMDELTITLNALDQPGLGAAAVYVSVIGTSAEDADSGQVGRGNRANGLIAVNRSSGAEATAGKNPLSHVGKIYSVLSHLLARKIHERTVGVEEVIVRLARRIGEPVDRPATVSVETRLAPDAAPGDVRGVIEEVIAEQLERMAEFCDELARGLHAVC